MAAKATGKKIKITLVRSPIGATERHKRTVKALGLRKLNHSIVAEDSPTVRGMVNSVTHLLKVEEA
ncbi:MAG: 50S ribosomal protein L30 [Anaerolineales bacterium]|jgi:large subunit ribosomal protein L30|nr:50S ribosomal protein L30 [Anaerolineales bacterium]MBX3004212.1 50S ribosomal protein L30 [Anaerolineales bacterium]